MVSGDNKSKRAYIKSPRTKEKEVEKQWQDLQTKLRLNYCSSQADGEQTSSLSDGDGTSL